jgi:hypothetical protein
MHTSDRTHVGRGAFALLAAGPMIVVGHALSTDIGNSGQRFVHEFGANRPLHAAGGLVTATAALLLSVGLWAAGRFFAHDGRRFAGVAATGAAAGAVGLAVGLGMVAMVMGALVGANPHLAVRAYNILNHGSLSSLPFLVAYLFTIGVLALSVSLLLAGGRWRLTGALLLVGTLVDFVSPSGGAATAALHVPQAIAFVLLGVNLVKSGRLTHKSASVTPAPLVEASPAPLAAS